MFASCFSQRRDSANIGEIPIDEAGDHRFNAATLSPLIEG